MEPIISIKNASFRYTDNGDCAVKNVSFSVNEGEFVCVLGRNGSGKSTMSKLLNGLNIATGGTVTINGVTIKDEDSAYLARLNCSMVFQNPDNQIVATIVEEDVAFALENIGLPQKEIRARVDKALSDVNMSEFALSAPHLLSGGQKQRIAIAGALALSPKIIVFDEATAMLDPTGREEILNTAHRLNKENGVTIVWVTHFMEEALTADRVIVMSEGEIALEGDPVTVFSNRAQIETLGLKLPFVMETIDKLKQNGIDVPDTIKDVKELGEYLCRYL